MDHRSLDPMDLPRLPRINPGRTSGATLGSPTVGHGHGAPSLGGVSHGSEVSLSEVGSESTSPKGSDAKTSTESPRSEMPSEYGHSPSYARKYFNRRYTPSEASSSMGLSPRLSLNFSPRHGGSSVVDGDSRRGGESHATTPTRKYAAKRQVAQSFGNGIPAVNGGLVLVTDDMIHNITKKKAIIEEDEIYAVSGDKVKIPEEKRATYTRMNWIGLLLFLFYIGCAIFYFYTRATKTLDMGYYAYGAVVLAIEIIASTATIGYGVLLTRWTRSRKTRGLPIAKPGHIPNEDKLKFHVRVLVPCYKESVELVQTTVLAALKAPLPADTRRTVYLCDDGKDENKREMVAKLGKDVEYISGRVRETGEVNGKSNNLNFALKTIYGELDIIPVSEVVVVFDADMVAKPNFFTKILEIMSDDDVSLTLTPQGFSNVNPQSDIFNNLNLSFWEYMLPGCDALGYIACTGTNFCLRARSLKECGWFPTWSITEDYLLGMEMRKRHMKAVYLNEYLAVGEAPEEIRNIFRQRSRWCKGQMQVLFSRACPLFDIHLPFTMRLLYTSVTWSYITNTLAVPITVMVPFVSLVFGVYPLVLNFDFALAATLFYGSGALITNFCISTKHLKPLWFTTVSCHLLWFTFTKAMINVLLSKLRIKKKSVFKVTKKKGEDGSTEDQKGCCACLNPANMGDMGGTKDVFVLCLSFFFSLITALVGIYQIVDQPYTAQGDFRWYLLLSVFWALYNLLSPSLFIFYCYRNDRVFEEYCSFAYLASFLVAAGGIACIWLVPSDYDMGQVLNNAMQYYEAQRSGTVPANSDVPWATSSGLYDSTILPNGKNYSLVGGWYDSFGYLKITYSTAFTTALLAWSVLDFNGGYASSGNALFGVTTFRQGSDYLETCAPANLSGSGQSFANMLIVQVGDMQLDSLYWGLPKLMPLTRPASFVGGNSKKPGSDVIGMTAAALAAASMAVQSSSVLTSQTYLATAVSMYKLATGTLGLYSSNAAIQTITTYPSVSFYDDLAFAAAWLYRATSDPSYLADAEKYYQISLQTDKHVNPNPYMWNYENALPGAALLLAQLTGSPTYLDPSLEFVRAWIRGDGVNVVYTKKQLALAQPAGTLQHTGNAAFFVLLYAKLFTGSNQLLYSCWARSQIGYMLGDSGRSYVVGYGISYPQKVPHEGASCPNPNIIACTWETAYYTTNPNPNTLRGALVGGPNVNDEWSDDRDETNPANMVTLLNNAGFTAALAGLTDLDVNMAKCQQGNGFIQNIMLKVMGKQNTPGQHWWNGLASV